MLNTFIGTITQPAATGNQSYTGVGFRPKFVMFLGNNLTAAGSAADAQFGFGMMPLPTLGNPATWSIYVKNAVAASSDTESYMDTSAVYSLRKAAAQAALAKLVTHDADGFTLNWTVTDGTARKVTYIAFGGDDFTTTNLGQRASPGANISEDASPIGFRPKFALTSSPALLTTDPSAGIGTTGNITPFIGWTTSPSNLSNPVKAYASGTRHANAVTPTVARRIQRNSSLLQASNTGINNEATISSFDANGLTIGWTSTIAQNDFFYIFELTGGLQMDVGVITQPIVTGSQVITTLPFHPNLLFLQSIGEATSTTNDANGRLSFGCGTDSIHRASYWYGDTDAVATSVASQDYDTTKIIKFLTEAGASPTLNAAADLTSLDPNGFTLNWTTADSTAREIIYVAFGSGSGIPPLNAFRPRLFSPGVAR